MLGCVINTKTRVSHSPLIFPSRLESEAPDAQGLELCVQLADTFADDRAQAFRLALELLFR